MPRFRRTKAVLRSKIFRVVCGFVVFVLIAQHVYLYFAIEKIRDEIRAMGYPVTLDEMLSPGNNSEEQERAKSLYESAFDAFELDGEDIESAPIFSNCCYDPDEGWSFSEIELARMERALAKNSASLESLHLAARTETFQFWVTEEGDAYFEESFAWNAHQRNAGRLLSLESLHMAETGRFSEAADSVVTGLAVARLHQPFGIGLLVSSAVDGISRSTFEDLVSRHELSRSDLEKLHQAFLSASVENRVAFAATTEASYTNHILDEKSSESEYWNDPLLVFEGAVLTSAGEMLGKGWRFSRRQAARVIGIDARIRLVAYQNAKRIVEVAELLTGDAVLELEEYLDGGSESWLMDRVADEYVFDFDFFVPILEVEGRYIAGHRAASTAAAIELYVLDSGTLPESLGDLVPDYMPAVPKDPFDGMDLRYARSEDGYAIYSISKDLTDDGGDLYPRNGRGRDAGVFIRN